MIIPILSLFKKDLSIMLKSPMFYLLIGLCCCFWGVFFAFQVFFFANQSLQFLNRTPGQGLNIHQHLVANYLVFIYYFLIFVIVALSLRFFTEEKKLKTFSLLLSAPISSWQIVLGKTLFGISFLFIFLLVSSIYPISLTFFTTIPIKLLLLGYFGVFLLLCISMMGGLLVSILTDSLVVCVVLTMLFSLLIQFLGAGVNLSESIYLQEVFNFLSLGRHFSFFRKGVLNISSVFYLLSWSFLMGFLTEKLVEFHRWR